MKMIQVLGIRFRYGMGEIVCTHFFEQLLSRYYDPRECFQTTNQKMLAFLFGFFSSCYHFTVYLFCSKVSEILFSTHVK